MSEQKRINRSKLKPVVLDLLKTGAHFGHATHSWNPKMTPYIFTEKEGQHVIDLEITAEAIFETMKRVSDVVANGGKIIFVGTKRQAVKSIEDAAKACGQHYINIRWLGGTLTNWQTISERIKYLNEREAQFEAGEFNALNKKEQLDIQKEIDKLNRRLGGIKELTSLPDLLFVVDTQRESLAIKEAERVNLPVVALVDTNCDPDPINLVIPCNDDSHRPIRYITSLVASAANEGRERHLKDLAQGPSDAELEDEVSREYIDDIAEEVEAADEEELLGPGALKLIAEMGDAEETASEEPAAAGSENQGPVKGSVVDSLDDDIVEEVEAADEEELLGPGALKLIVKVGDIEETEDEGQAAAGREDQGPVKGAVADSPDDDIAEEVEDADEEELLGPGAFRPIAEMDNIKETEDQDRFVSKPQLQPKKIDFDTFFNQPSEWKIDSDTSFNRLSEWWDFNRLSEWWDDANVRVKVITDYERQVWPQWLRKDQDISGQLKSGSEDHWLALLVLGACQSLGRTQDSQHRRFLERVHGQGWWDIFKVPEDVGAWMGMLRDWQDGDLDPPRWMWMSLFPAIYQLSRYQDVYVRLLKSAGQRPDNYDIGRLLAPRVDEALTGGGTHFDAPRSPLDMGLHWVLRELVRLKVVEGVRRYRDCWVPSEQVLHFLCDLGLDRPYDGMSNPQKAHAIFDFLASKLGTATPNLHRAFDIPIRHVIRHVNSNQDLRRRLGLEQ